MTKYTNTYLTVLVFLIFCSIQLFFAPPYHTDKTVVSSQIIQSMFKNKSIVAHNIPCNDDKQHKHLTWAEEPPIYHLIGTLFLYGGATDYLYKMYPLLCFLFSIFMMYKIILLLFPESRNFINWLWPLLIFQPYIYIHAHRPLPDNLALSFLLCFFYFYLCKRYRLAWLFSILAVTTKALALFAIFGVCLADTIQSYKNGINLKKHIYINLSYALSVIPFLLWLIYLYREQISNPFFIDHIDIHHTGGSNFAILFTRKYWSRLLS